MTYEEAIEKYERLIYYTMGKYKIQGFELEDMFNRGRYIMWECLKTYDESKQLCFSTYLVMSLQNECRKMYKFSQRAKRSKDNELKSLSDYCKDSLTYEQVLECKEYGNVSQSIKELYDLTNRLPKDDKEIMIKFLDMKLKHNQDYTIKEFCKDFKVSYVKMRRILDDYRYVINVYWGY